MFRGRNFTESIFSFEKLWEIQTTDGRKQSTCSKLGSRKSSKKLNPEAKKKIGHEFQGGSFTTTA